jgi:hypothetical protein
MMNNEYRTSNNEGLIGRPRKNGREIPLRFSSHVEDRLLHLSTQEEVGLLKGWMTREGEWCSFSRSLNPSSAKVILSACLPSVWQEAKNLIQRSNARKGRRHSEGVVRLCTEILIARSRRPKNLILSSEVEKNCCGWGFEILRARKQHSG